MTTNIWNTTEISAISMNFSYADYLDLCKKSDSPHKPVSRYGYQLLVNLFNTEMFEATA